MELNSILSTNAIRVLTDIEPPRIYPPDLARAVVDRYKFVKFPQTVEDFSGESMEFAYGKFFDAAIVTKLIIYNSGVWAEAPIGSKPLDAFLDDLMQFLHDDFGVNTPSARVLSVYGSTLVVSMKPGFAALFEKLAPVVSAITNAMQEAGISVSNYEVGGFTILGEGPDVLKPPRFVLERRAGESFESNLFFSQAPLATEQHLSLLSEIEAMFSD